MIQVTAIGIGAGLVSALLVAVMTTGSLLAFALFFLAPVPIVIAALGWNHRVGLVATFVGAAVLAAGLHPSTGLFFAVGTGLPAWWLSYLALLARPQPEGPPEWYPLGRLLAWIAALSGVLTVASFLSLGLDYPAFLTTIDRIVERVLAVYAEALKIPAGSLAVLRTDLSVFLALFGFPLAAALSVVITAFVLWAGGLSVAKSGRLPRPWPVLADLSLPREALFALAVSGGLGLLDGYAGLTARTVCAAFVAAFGLQGLAVLHKVTLGLKGRSGILAALYAMTAALSGWPLVLFAVGGVADHFVDFRARLRRGPPPPPLAGGHPTEDRRNPWK